MKNIQELINYTLNKKKNQLLDKNYFLEIPTQEIQDYLNDDEDDSTIGLSFMFLSTYHHNEYTFSCLSNNIASIQYLKTATIYAIESVNWDLFLSKKFPNYDESIPFEKSIKYLAQAFLLGWDELGFQYGNLLLKMLYGKQYKGGHPAYLHPWFMLEIFCKWQKITLDYNRLNAPKDMKIYSEILANWDTQDTDLLQKMVQQLVDFHIAQSDEDEYGDRTPDFPSSDYFVYPIEILFWLNIRSRLQLSDYQPDNDLMRLPINDYCTQHTDIPKIDLIEKAKQKLMQDYPNIAFEVGD